MTAFEPYFRFVLATLACWRVTHLLAVEDGPADLIFRLRFLLGDRFAGKLMDCFQCLSLWVAVPISLFVTLRPVDCLFSWLALSGAACLLERAWSEPGSGDLAIQGLKGESKDVLWSETGSSAR